jgi:hypothetical protein
MTKDSKGVALLAQIAKGLITYSKHQTATQLGDRSTYVGMSDIGKGAECLRAAVADRLHPGRTASAEQIVRWYQDGEHDRIRAVLRRQLTLQRGHWMEAGFAGVLNSNGANVLHQLEIATEHEGIPIKAHLDFTLVWGWPRPAVRILELKTAERIPDTLYTGYEVQLYGQLGLLHSCWSQPVFSMKDAGGNAVFTNLTFPQAVKKAFGISLPQVPHSVDLEGWVLCLSMSDARAFGPYRPDTNMLHLCRRIASELWMTTQRISDGTESSEKTLSKVPHCTGFHPLCDWCDHADDCPKFTAQELTDPAYDEALTRLTMLKENKASLEASIASEEKRIRSFCQSVGIPSGWLKTNRFRFRTITQTGRKTIDTPLLRQELRNGLGEGAAESLLTRVTRTGAPFQRLYISPRMPEVSATNTLPTQKEV